MNLLKPAIAAHLLIALPYFPHSVLSGIRTMLGSLASATHALQGLQSLGVNAAMTLGMCNKCVSPLPPTDWQPLQLLCTCQN